MRYLRKRVSSIVILVLIFSMLFENVAYAADAFYDDENQGVIDNILYDDEEEINVDDIVVEKDSCSEETFYIDWPEETISFDDGILPSNDELFAAYVDTQLGDSLFLEQPINNYTSTVAYSSYVTGSRFSGRDEEIYNILAKKIKAIASGEDSEAIIYFAPEDMGLKKEYTISDMDEDGNYFYDSANRTWDYSLIMQDVYTRYINANSYDMSTIKQALMADYPYELFWYDKTTGLTQGGGISYSIVPSGSKVIIEYPETVFYIKMTVSADYSATGEKNTYNTNARKISSIKKIKTNAMAIVNKYSSYSDYDKLIAYAEEICSLTDYNSTAANNSSTPYGDPWQLIYVFDNDSSTKVVCEGYAKAFKYLCDLSEFDYDSLWCYTVTGTMTSGSVSGPHMWNVVHMKDGYNYMVDVTNADQSRGIVYTYLLSSPASGNVDSGYFFDIGYSTPKYVYDSSTKALYFYEQLDLLNKMYDILKPVTKDGFTYQPNSDGTARITACTLKGDIVIPESIDGYTIISLEKELFRGKSGVTSVSIPKYVQAFGYYDYIFSYCYDLKEINVDSDNPYLCSVDGVLYSKDKKILYNYPVDKEGVTFKTFSETTFLCCTSFASQKYLTSLYLTNSNTTWAGFTFYNTPNLKVYYHTGGTSETTANNHISYGKNHEQDSSYPTYVVYDNTERYIMAYGSKGKSSAGTIEFDMYFEVDKGTYTDNSVFIKVINSSAEESSYTISQLSSTYSATNQTYIVAVPATVKPKEMSNICSVQFYSGNVAISEKYETRFASYLYSIMRTYSKDSAEYQVALSLSKLGDATQGYFSYNLGNPIKNYTKVVADTDTSSDSSIVQSLNAYHTSSFKDTSSMMDIIGVSLSLKDKVAVNYYFYVDDNFDLNSFSAYKDKNYKVEKTSNNVVRMTIADIPYTDASKIYHYKLYYGNSLAMEIDYSITDYIAAVLSGGTTDDSLKTLCRTMYLFVD